MKNKIEEIFRERHTGNITADLRIMLRLLRPYTTIFVAAVLCSLILSGINGAIAWLIKPVLDSIFIKKSSSLLILLPAGVIILFLLRGIFTYFTNYLMNSIGAKTSKSLRENVYDKLLSLPLSFYNRTSSGSVISRILSDIEILNVTVAFTIKDFFVQGGTVIILAFVAIVRKWDLALLSFVVIPLIIYSIGYIGILMKKITARTRKLISEVTTILHESIQGMKIIKSFTMEKNMSDRYSTALHEHYRNYMREVRTNEFSQLMAEVLGGIGVAIIVFYGGYLVIHGEISAGSFFSFVAAILLIYTPLKRLSKVTNKFQEIRSIFERIREIFILDSEREGGIETSVARIIEFRNVSFRYPEAHNFALKNVNLKISEGEVIALVGHSGAGKSTLVDLIAGFWYPTEGDILIDGVSTKDLSLKSLRRHLGIVSQDIILFNESIRANICFGRHDAPEEEIKNAAEAAYAHDFIMGLPQRYDTKVGERGVKLSGGEKQRITIARSILKNPSILLLDEATSSLDTESEHMVRQALEKLMSKRTTVVIAHRLSTVKNASRIIVMNQGSIVQEGTHEELLLQEGGLYRELYDLQFRT
jgi:subfamily B ATP-binding cassette protein MsbA